MGDTEQEPDGVSDPLFFPVCCAQFLFTPLLCFCGKEGYEVLSSRGGRGEFDDGGGFEPVMDVADLAEAAQKHTCTVFHVAGRLIVFLILASSCLMSEHRETLG